MIPPPPIPNLLPRMTGLPTMHNLPSDDPLEPGLPDEFHGLQPQLLAETLSLTGYSDRDIFCAFDLNLYYDPESTGWYKRLDWFLRFDLTRLLNLNQVTCHWFPQRFTS
jgi:Uma2 family endonuclease